MNGQRGPAPERLGAYVVERRLGSGGMGVVYLARTVAGRRLAVKVIRSEYAEDPGFRTRFRREVAAVRRVSGAFTAPVVDADPDGDPPWLATLYVPGGSLTDRVEREGPLTVREAARVGAQLAEALQDIHGCGLVHRDLKPGNVLLAEDGVRVIDFGISRALTDSHRLTEVGAVLGSPPFMAPEQLTGAADATTAADVFALGAVVAFAATGHSPFEPGGSFLGDPLAVAYRVVHEEPELDDVPESLRELVSLCLAKDPARRPGLPALLRMADLADTRARAALVNATPAHAPAHEPAGEPAAPDTEPGGERGTAAGPRRGRRRWLAGAAAAAVLLSSAGGGMWLAQSPADTGAGHEDGEVAAPSAEDLEPWEIDLREFGVLDAPTEGFACKPADAGLLCTSGGKLTVVLDRNGEEVLRYDGPRDAMGGPEAITGYDTVYTRSDKGLVALDIDGRELWEIDAPQLAGALHQVFGTLMLQNGESTLRFYETGWQDPVGMWEAPGRYITRTLGNRGGVLVETRSGDLGDDPQLMLIDSLGREAWPTPRRPPDDVAGVLEPVGLDGEAAYFQEVDPELPVIIGVMRMDLESGEWTRTELPQPAEPRSVVADGIVYASTMGGQLTAVDAAEGTVLWNENIGVSAMSRPGIAEGSVWVSDGEGRLHQVDAGDGSVVGTGEAHPGTSGLGSDAYASPPVVVDGVAYVVTLGNTLYATRVGEE
ncbi:protein kinase domain-containing protein [Streptomyces sp. SBT349]|uniref:protein kinase domain-containing protein n=1 Tax=Streptomyces sp. SBT349 TaxID=1580539 RepID=UPI00066D8F1E|nr:protein kinase [Streptomyces sp. SBT349]